jgi:hypothetical protein
MSPETIPVDIPRHFLYLLAGNFSGEKEKGAKDRSDETPLTGQTESRNYKVKGGFQTRPLLNALRS